MSHSYVQVEETEHVIPNFVLFEDFCTWFLHISAQIPPYHFPCFFFILMSFSTGMYRQTTDQTNTFTNN